MLMPSLPAAGCEPVSSLRHPRDGRSNPLFASNKRATKRQDRPVGSQVRGSMLGYQPVNEWTDVNLSELSLHAFQ